MGLTYRQLLSEKQFLKVAMRARALSQRGTYLYAIYYKDGTLYFKTRSATDEHVIYTQRIQLTAASFENIIECKTFKDVEKLIKDGDIKIHCNCLAEGTRVLTREGYKLIQDVVFGDEVWSSDYKWHRVMGINKSGVKDNWVKVHVCGLIDPLVVTTDHKLLFSSYRDKCCCGCGRDLRGFSDSQRNRLAFKLFGRRMYLPKHSGREVADGFERYQLHALDNYKVGELLCGTGAIEGHIPFDKDYARMLGYYLAEGCIPKHGSTVRLTFNCNEEFTIVQDIIDYFTSKDIKVKKSFGHAKDDRHWLNIEVYSYDFREDCKKYCGQYSKLKFPNTEILSWNKEARVNFILGHLLGDGHVDDSFRWMSSSRDLVDMMQVLLGSIGIHASTYIANSARNNSSTVYCVSCAFNKFFPYYEQYKHLFREKDRFEMNNSRGQYDVDTYSLFKIMDMEEAEPQCGYDLCLADEPHTYLADNLFVSNCPAFLYWGYKYMAWKGGYGIEKETRRPVVRNPYERGHLCKHLFLVLQIFPFMTKAIASKFNRWVHDTLKYEESIKQSSYLGKYNVKTNRSEELSKTNESTEGFKIDEGGSVEPLEGGNQQSAE